MIKTVMFLTGELISSDVVSLYVQSCCVPLLRAVIIRHTIEWASCYVVAHGNIGSVSIIILTI